MYGPDDRHVTNLTVGIIVHESDEVVDLRRWHSDAGDLRQDPEIENEIIDFTPCPPQPAR